MTPNFQEAALRIALEAFGGHSGFDKDPFMSLVGTKHYDKVSDKLQTFVKDSFESKFFEYELNLEYSSKDIQTHLKGSLVGLFCTGRFSFATVRLDNSIWVSNSLTCQRKGFAGIDSDDDTNLELNEIISKQALVNLSGIPGKYLKKKISKNAFHTRTVLERLLTDLNKASGIPIVCDSFFATELSYDPNLSTSKPEFTIGECLEAISRAHYHGFRVIKGILVGSSMGLGLDVRSETPPKLLISLSKAVLDKESISLEDAIALSQMSTAQWEALPYNHSAPIPQAQVLSSKKYQFLLKLYGSLSQEDKLQAQCAKGLRLIGLKADQRTHFDRLACVGFPRTPPKSISGNTSGLYLLRNRVDDKKVGLSFCLIPEDPSESRVYSLPIVEMDEELKFAH